MSETVCKHCGRMMDQTDGIWVADNTAYCFVSGTLHEPAEPAPPSVNYIAETTPVEPGTPTCQVCGALATKSASGWVCKACGSNVAEAVSQTLAVPKLETVPDCLGRIAMLRAEIASLRSQLEEAAKSASEWRTLINQHLVAAREERDQAKAHLQQTEQALQWSLDREEVLKRDRQEAIEARERHYSAYEEMRTHLAEAERKGATEMLVSIRASLADRAERGDECSGGDVEIMKSVDRIVQNAYENGCDETIEAAAKIVDDKYRKGCVSEDDIRALKRRVNDEDIG